ncbi:MAG: DUF4440 domain-containing protein [Gemmatimonadetes bacterium]|nr:nuclear transport factor 2 family protein [Gemmatimonadota bacterium]NIQ57178.1 nuclear transport factor 2 family protein [Gemmatimonadota bacterium]NIU77353.1 DUF4440 domain-containing protein [Gammaproteobacteria bacterium]NIX46611.1 DUF4440 domain-containing protein [Gemmatimonadota bacterium]NIY10935.1 DUF4440 domain-containing protein [Gemmatimonadota bacterium]
MHENEAADAILALERNALDHWSRGDPLGYVEDWAEDATYFDDIGAQSRIDGLEALRAYASTLAGQLPAHEFELVDPKVQVFGDTGVLTLRYHPRTADGEPLPAWKATLVYRRDGGRWRVAHGNWSIVKEG